MQGIREKRGLQIFISIFLLCLLCFCLIQTESISDGIRGGLSLCARAIVPTLFPFLVLSDLLLTFTGTERMLGILSRPVAFLLRLSPYGGIAFLLGNLFGFPIGARTVAKYYQGGLLSKEEGERLLLFTGNASPFFLIGSVGIGMFSSLQIGVFLYLLQGTISFFTGFLLTLPCGRKKKVPPSRFSDGKRESDAFSFPVTLQKAVLQTLFICGYILFFSAVVSLLLPFLDGTPLAPFLPGMLEIGNAAAYASRYGGPFAVAFCAFSASFSGLSVYFQTADCIKETDLSLRFYLPVKLLCGAFAFFVTLFFSRLH